MNADTVDQTENELEIVDLECGCAVERGDEEELSKEERLPDTDYDAIIVGTGLVESIVSAALSRIGKAVLHLDRNTFYGSEWSAIPLNKSSPLGGFEKRWRHFNLDKSPKLLYARGAMVELLVQSKVSRYLEFRGVGRTLSYIDGNMVEVPCSAADVFNTKLLKLTEKNVIKRFLTFCLNHDQHTSDYQDFADQPFKVYLATWPVGKKPQLSPFLRQLVLHSIAMCGEEVSTEDGLKATQYYLRSIGRYGNTPFLWPMYGSGELPQAFCRMSAVFGGIFVLNRSLRSIVMPKGEASCTGAICSHGQRVKCKWLVMNKEYCPAPWRVVKTEAQATEAQGTEDNSVIDSSSISRLVLITNQSLSPSSTDDIEEPFLLTIPPNEELKVKRVTHLLELPSSTAACPTGCYIVQLTSLGANSEEDFSAIVEKFFQRKQAAAPSPPPPTQGTTTAVNDADIDTASSPTTAESEPYPTGTDSTNVSLASGSECAAGDDPSNARHTSSSTEDTADGGVASSLVTADSEDKRPMILESFFFNQTNPVCQPATSSGACLRNVLVTDSANAELGFLSVVKQAREFFDLMCPGEEFLPAAPEPEDICFDHADSSGKKESTDAQEAIEGGESQGSSDVAAQEERAGGVDPLDMPVPVVEENTADAVPVGTAVDAAPVDTAADVAPVGTAAAPVEVEVENTSPVEAVPSEETLLQKTGEEN